HRPPPRSSLCPYTTLFRSEEVEAEVAAAQVDRPGVPVARPADLAAAQAVGHVDPAVEAEGGVADAQLRVLGGETLVEHLALAALDRKSTRLNSSHSQISYA